jgi:FkbM family methyltransferase
MRRPLKADTFAIIRESGAPIAAVIDVGVQSSTPELISAFPDKKQYLIEPIVEWNKAINYNYERQRIDFEVFNVAASDRDGSMNIELSTIKPELPITHARLTESIQGPNLRKVPVRRLDSLSNEFGWKGPFLLKIDVDGAELAILNGAEGIIDQCIFIIVEAQTENIVERMTAVTNKGFELFDIVDICYHDGRLAQLDLVFVSKAMSKKHSLHIFAKGFKFELWQKLQ